MTKDEALRMALEALNRNDYLGWQTNIHVREAIREALAQPEQEPEVVAVIGNWGRVEWRDGVYPQLGDRMYSAPFHRKPLTDEQWQVIADTLDCLITRKQKDAIEAVIGIKE